MNSGLDIYCVIILHVNVPKCHEQIMTMYLRSTLLFKSSLAKITLELWIVHRKCKSLRCVQMQYYTNDHNDYTKAKIKAFLI